MAGEILIATHADVSAFREAAPLIEWLIVTHLAGQPERSTMDEGLLGILPADIRGEEARRSALNRALSTLEHTRIGGAQLLRREEVEAREAPELTDLGNLFRLNGLPEERLLRLLQERSPRTIAEIREHKDFDDGRAGNAIGTLKRAGVISVRGPEVHLEKPELPEDVRRLATILKNLGSPGGDWVGGFDERDWAVIRENSRTRGSGSDPLRIRSQKRYRIRLLVEFDASHESFERTAEKAMAGSVGPLTPEMLRDGTWRGKEFRRWNLALRPAAPPIGRRHPYREYLDSVKRKLTAMGFVEMVGSLVETEFWNMDALYMPQFHSAREIHDIYLVKDPPRARALPAAVAARVATAHRDGGGTGSTGWRYEFDADRSRQTILRSHGTVLSARTLASAPKVPGKYFAVARCFRPDVVDASHAADFFQIEGIVLGKTINFRSLLGLLRLFGYEIARATECRFVPAYFPFTEPSVEVHMRHPTLGWMELGGAGIFRPELTKPLGVDVPVIAWGLGVDRMAMVALGVDDIRDLFTADLAKLREMKVRAERH
ncbi:MAG: phenylalanine--tRNA ligase subunit alpha [Planctomycetales bacterium]|nr:phenylalanine--tRNA ligase subunit alpha [Planctomycetales bacterium]